MRTVGRIRTLARGAFAELPGETAAVGAALIALVVLIHAEGDCAWATWAFCAALPMTPMLFALTIARRAGRIGRRLHVGLALAVAVGTFAAVASGISNMNELDELPVAVPYLSWLVVAVACPLVITWLAAPADERQLAFARFVAELITAGVSVCLIGGAAMIAAGLLAYALHALFGLSSENPMLDLFALIGAASALVLLHDVRPGARAGDGEERAVPRICRRLVTMVGAPFVGAMFAIVTVYEVVVLVGGELPSNVLGPLLVGTGATGFACALVIQSMLHRGAPGGPALVRQVGEGWERSRSIQIVRVLPLLLVVVLPLAMWGLYIRIDQHGFTPERAAAMYMLACLGALGLAGTVRLIRRRGPLSWEIPACAAVFALATGFGPLSATALTHASQTERLEAELAELGNLRAGSPHHGVSWDRYIDLASRIELLEELGGAVVDGVPLDCTERGSEGCLEQLGIVRADAAEASAPWRELSGSTLIDRPPGRVLVVTIDGGYRDEVASPDGQVGVHLDGTHLRFRLGARHHVLDLLPVVDAAPNGGQLTVNRFPLADVCGSMGELVIHHLWRTSDGIRDLRATWLLPADEHCGW